MKQSYPLEIYYVLMNMNPHMLMFYPVCLVLFLIICRSVFHISACIFAENTGIFINTNNAVVAISIILYVALRYRALQRFGR